MFFFAWIALSIVNAVLGRKRLLGFWGYLFASIVFSPFLVLPILLLTVPRRSS
jgi:hypothetical protein